MEIRIVDLRFMITGGLTGRYQKFTGTPDPSNLKKEASALAWSYDHNRCLLGLRQLAFLISKRLKDTWKATIYLQNIKTSSF